MIDQRQQAYLDAIGIETWTLRHEAPLIETLAEPRPVRDETVPDTPVSEPVADPPGLAGETGLQLGPGRGGVLLVCAEDTDSASRLANDINRTMGGNPVWGWPASGAKAASLDAAIEENLFTHVGIFGEELGRQYFPGEPPKRLNAANLVFLPSMRELQVNAKARKALWSTLCRFGMVSASDDQA